MLQIQWSDLLPVETVEIDTDKNYDLACRAFLRCYISQFFANTVRNTQRFLEEVVIQSYERFQTWISIKDVCTQLFTWTWDKNEA